MKIRGELLIREIAGEIIAIPVGRTALEFNGMICLNEVSKQIWSGLQEEKTRDEILGDLMEEFDVSPEEAAADIDEFILRLWERGLLED